MKTLTIDKENELEAIATEVVQNLVQKSNAHLITIQGDLGAGKTALTKQIAHVLGIKESVTSPTFVIMKMYAIEHHSFLDRLIHIDAYRIESDDELRVLGFDEICADPKTLICLEWPERLQSSLQTKEVFPISIVANLEGSRVITYGN